MARDGSGVDAGVRVHSLQLCKSRDVHDVHRACDVCAVCDFREAGNLGYFGSSGFLLVQEAAMKGERLCSMTTTLSGHHQDGLFESRSHNGSSFTMLRTTGNQNFRNGQYGKASALYEGTLRLLQARGSADPKEESVLYSNRAACYLKDGNCTDCIKDCTSVLTLVPFSIKPLLRRACAYEALEKYTLAYVDYKTVLQIDNSVASALEGINRITRALMDSLGPAWRLKLPPIHSCAQKRWNSLPSENHKETAKNKSKEITKSRVPSAGDMERAKVLKEEGNELVKKGNHKKAIEKYSESLLFSSLESA
ncbi:hypothetical protein U0070_013729, partial [Myodes glareolus]